MMQSVCYDTMQYNVGHANAFLQVEEVIPSLRRFKNQWAVEYLAKEVFGGRKSYRSCKDVATTYRGKQAVIQQAKRYKTPSTSASPQPRFPSQRQDSPAAQPEGSGEEPRALAAERPPFNTLPDVSDLPDLSDSDA